MRTRVGPIFVNEPDLLEQTLKGMRRELSEVYKDGFLRIRSAKEANAPKESLFFSTDRSKPVYKNSIGEIIELA